MGISTGRVAKLAIWSPTGSSGPMAEAAGGWGLGGGKSPTGSKGREERPYHTTKGAWAFLPAAPETQWTFHRGGKGEEAWGSGVGTSGARVCGSLHTKHLQGPGTKSKKIMELRKGNEIRWGKGGGREEIRESETGQGEGGGQGEEKVKEKGGGGRVVRKSVE